jgi:ParB/RepB/Spo0J family partition protein
MSALKELVAPSVGQIELWPIERVLTNPLNPRGELAPESLDELAASILEHGILTPLLVVPAGEFVHIVAGHRRRAAALMARMRELPVIVHRFTPVEQLEIMLVENLQRKDLSPLQEARGFQSLIAAGLRHKDIARRLGIDAARVRLGLDLLKLDETVARSIDRGDLPIYLIREFARVPDPAEQRRYATLALQRQVKAKELADYMRQQQSAEAHITVTARPPAPPDPGTDAHQTLERNGAGAQGSDGSESTGAPQAGPVAARPEAHTRSEAAALLSGDSIATFADMRRALRFACQGCDEEHYPAICRACPMPQFIASIVAEVRRARR